MTASYERIHYGLRPAKNIQRKMLGEAFRRLSLFAAVDSYRYIGFGSTYFSDFLHFHKTLGICDMVSIEKDVHNRKRFEFNCPFRCVQMVFGESTAVLPTLKWDSKTILWLDYDGALEPSVLADVRLFCAQAQAGSVLVVTVNADPAEYDPEKPRIEEFKKRLGKERIPPDVKEEDLAQWGTAQAYRRIITAEILQTIRERNGLLVEQSRISYKPLFYFCYADGAKMLTVGGLLFEAGQVGVVEKCAFRRLDFIRDNLRLNTRPCFIEVPNLTYREMRHLDKRLPRGKKSKLKVPRVSATEVKKYERVYRFFPTFAETEI